MKTSTPISKYNEVVDFYNAESGTSVKLVYLDESMLYMKFYKIQQKVVGRFLIILSLLIPMINILVIVIQAKCCILLKNQMKKVKRNSIMIPNPFLFFQKDNDLCDQLGSHSSSVNLEIQRNFSTTQSSKGSPLTKPSRMNSRVLGN